MLMQLLIDTINAVPTPRFDVGENVLEAQDLSSNVVSTSFQMHDQRHSYDARHSHHQREQAIVAPNHQEQRKVRRADRLLHRRRQDEVSDERGEAGAHDVVAAVLRARQQLSLQTNGAYYLTFVRSLCTAWKNTRNQPAAYGATVSPCALIAVKPSPLMSCRRVSVRS